MLKITGGKVYDPKNNVDGAVKDICIDEEGRIASKVDAAARTIDATGMMVFPGGVDVHTHVAGGVAAWKWGKNASTLHEPIEGYKKVTAATIIAGLAQIIDDLGLPHPLHLHQNNLGVPGNVTTTLETMKVLEQRRAHLAHLQFHAYGGHDWGSMKSEAATIAEAFNRNTNL